MNKASAHAEIQAWAECFEGTNFFEKNSKNVLTNHNPYGII